MNEELQICLLGNFRLYDTGKPVYALYTPRLKFFLAYLLLHLDTPLPRSQVAYLIWPDTPEGQARNNLRHLLYQVRHSLPSADLYIEADNHELCWNRGAAYSLDVSRFQNAVEKTKNFGSGIDHGSLCLELETAIDLYTGDLLVECYEPWIIPKRDSLRHLYLETGVRLLEVLEKSGNYPSAIVRADKLLQFDPNNEELYRWLIRLNVFNGNRVQALRLYQTLAENLESEFGLQPSPATQDVYDRYLRFKRFLPKPAQSPEPSNLPLIGRSRQWLQIQGALRKAILGKPTIVLVSGEFGVGKTRLLEEILNWSLQQGWTAALARCSDTSKDLPYAPVLAWLRQCGLPTLNASILAEIARLFPELHLTTPVRYDPGIQNDFFQRQRLFAALSRAILGHPSPLVLMLDDLHLCDADTLAWLHYLLRYEPFAHLSLIITVSPEELALKTEQAAPIHQLWSSLRHDAVLIDVELLPLNLDGVAALTSELTNAPVTQRQAERLYHESRGVPFFLVELVRAGWLETEDLPLEIPGNPETAANETLPPAILHPLANRLDKLSEPARNLARLAAVLDHPIPRRVLRETSLLEEEALVDALDELIARRIFIEAGSTAYEFSHPQLRHVAFTTLSAARRRLLERRLASVLSRSSAGETPDTEKY